MFFHVTLTNYTTRKLFFSFSTLEFILYHIVLDVSILFTLATDGDITLEKNKVLNSANLITLYEEFDVSFELYINAKSAGNSWFNILRLTSTDENKSPFDKGDRLATVYTRGQLGLIHFSSARDDYQSYSHTVSLPVQTWIPLRIQQVLDGHNFRLKFSYDGNVVQDYSMNFPTMIYNDTKIYASSGGKLLNAKIRNLMISTSK